MTRYMITFRSIGEPKKRTKKVSQQIGEQVIARFESGENIIIGGDWYNVSDVESVRKITTCNGFDQDYVDQQSRAELAKPEEKLYLEQHERKQLK